MNILLQHCAGWIGEILNPSVQSFQELWRSGTTQEILYLTGQNKYFPHTYRKVIPSEQSDCVGWGVASPIGIDCILMEAGPKEPRKHMSRQHKLKYKNPTHCYMAPQGRAEACYTRAQLENVHLAKVISSYQEMLCDIDFLWLGLHRTKPEAWPVKHCLLQSLCERRSGMWDEGWANVRLCRAIHRVWRPSPSI